MTGALRAAALVSAWAALAAFAEPAAGHTRSLSYSSWEVLGERVEVDARVAQLDLSRLGLAFASVAEGSDPIGEYLESHLQLTAGGEPCGVRGPIAAPPAPEGWARRRWSLVCPGPGPRVLEGVPFLEVAPSHLHFARLTTPDGSVVDRVLSEASPRWRWPAAGSGVPVATSHTSLRGYLALGIEHILTGWDHLAFVLALLLLAATLREVAALVTSFTVAHSVTLGLATLGVVETEAAPVEALIGYSIALVAMENGWILGGRDRVVPFLATGGLLLLALAPGVVLSRPALLGLALFTLCHFALLRASERPARLRVAVAFGFGLVHGFGFAGVLAELELPTARLVPALFGFNAGVEVGQLGVVALVWPLLHWLGRTREGRLARWVAEAGSAAICGLGVFWFLTRSLG